MTAGEKARVHFIMHLLLGQNLSILRGLVAALCGRIAFAQGRRATAAWLHSVAAEMEGDI